MADEELSDDDRKLAARLKQAAPDVESPPPFDALFAKAERQYEASQHRTYGWFAAAAGIVAVVAVALFAAAPDEPEYIQVAELLGTTSWTAPSDVLMPQHEFDIYQELPELMESTRPVDGALL